MSFLKVSRIVQMSVNSCNCDRHGNGKDIIFGDILRDRWSSQSYTRQIRERFAATERCLNSPSWLGHIFGLVKEQLPNETDENIETIISSIFDAISIPYGKSKAEAAAAEEEASTEASESEVSEESKDKDVEGGRVCVRLSVAERDWLVKKSCEIAQKLKGAKEVSKKTIAKHLKDAKENLAALFLDVSQKVKYPELALFGRFVAGLQQIESATSFSHSISTNASDPAAEMFSAIDDLSTDDSRKTAHLGTKLVSASCMFSEMSLNIPLLLKNLGGDKEKTKECLPNFLASVALSVPKGKQKKIFSMPLATYLCFEILDSEFSMADAFIDPVVAERGLPLPYASVKRIEEVKASKYKTYDIVPIYSAIVCDGYDRYPECGVTKDQACSLNTAINNAIKNIKELK